MFSIKYALSLEGEARPPFPIPGGIRLSWKIKSGIKNQEIAI